MFKVIWSNEGGELDSGVATTEEGAAKILIEMIKLAGELHHGDRIRVVEIEDAAA